MIRLVHKSLVSAVRANRSVIRLHTFNMSKWGYGKRDGPHTWCDTFPLAAGNRQSPINISTKSTTWDQLLNEDPLTISYQLESEMEIFNSGHSLQATSAKHSVISKGPLENVYKLAQFHFHWGSDNERGSEHTINGKSYTAELHLVHWNTDLFDSLAEAVGDPKGLAVLGVFIKEGNTNVEFSPIIHAIEKVTYKSDNTKMVASLDPTHLLPANTSRYWTYPGSLTTPPCCECVTWVVFEEPIEMSNTQIEAFRSMMFDKGPCNNNMAAMCDNFRPTMPLNDRIVRSSFESN